MTEIELRKNKNGMVMLILLIVLYVLAIMATVIGAGIENYILVALGVIYISLGWIFFLGLKVLKPQEALVLTLVDKYCATYETVSYTVKQLKKKPSWQYVYLMLWLVIRK